MLTDFTIQSKFTDPGAYHFMYDHIPNDVYKIFEIVRGLLMHIRDAELFGYVIPQKRKAEIEYRYIHKILQRVFELDQGDLSKEKAPDKRVIATCRDFSILACSMLRHIGIPSRIRFGFSTYYYKLFYQDIVILEYWDSSCAEWRCVDVRTSERQIKGHKFNVDFDLYNIPNDKFIFAEDAWIKCRNKLVNKNLFGHDPLIKICGLWYVRNKLMQDLAAINKNELLLWDCWGYMLTTEVDSEVENSAQSVIFDEIADVMSGHEVDLEKAKILYDQPNIKVTQNLMSRSPVSGMQEVRLC